MKMKAAKTKSTKRSRNVNKVQSVGVSRRIATCLRKAEEALNQIENKIEASMQRQEAILQKAVDVQTAEIYSALAMNSRNFDLIQRELVNILGILNGEHPGPKNSGPSYSRTGTLSEGMHATPVDRRERQKP